MNMTKILLDKKVNEEENSIQGVGKDWKIIKEETMDLSMKEIFKSIEVINYNAQSYLFFEEKLEEYKRKMTNTNLPESMKKDIPTTMHNLEKLMNDAATETSRCVCKIIRMIRVMHDIDNSVDYLETGIDKWYRHSAYASNTAEAYRSKSHTELFVPFDLPAVKFITGLAVEKMNIGISEGHGVPLTMEEIEKKTKNIENIVFDYYRENVYFTEDAVAWRKKAKEEYAEQYWERILKEYHILIN